MGNKLTPRAPPSIHQRVYNELLSQLKHNRILDITLTFQNEKQKTIDLPQQPQPPLSLIYLSDNKCLIQYPRHYLILDLHSQQFTSHPFPCESTQRRILPYKDSSFCIQQHDRILIIDKDLATTQIPLKYPDQNMILFHQSGDILTMRGSCEITSIHFKYQQIAEMNKTRAKYIKKHNKKANVERLKYFGSVDQRHKIITSLTKDSLQIYDINNQEEQTVYLDSEMKFKDELFRIRPVNFYQIDENVSLIGFDDRELKIVSIGYLNMDGDKFSEIFKCHDSTNLRFLTINHSSRILAFQYIQGLGDWSTLYIIFYDYYLKRIQWKTQFRVHTPFPLYSMPMFYHKQSSVLMRISRDLRHYVELKSEEGKYRVVHTFASPKSKSLYFWVLRKSELWERYGERLAREVIKVLIDVE